MKTVNAFKCDYCNNLFYDEESCKFHENSCTKNPKVIRCEKCKYFSPGFFIEDDSCKLSKRLLDNDCNSFELNNINW